MKLVRKISSIILGIVLAGVAAIILLSGYIYAISFYQDHIPLPEAGVRGVELGMTRQEVKWAVGIPSTVSQENWLPTWTTWIEFNKIPVGKTVDDFDHWIYDDLHILFKKELVTFVSCNNCSRYRSARELRDALWYYPHINQSSNAKDEATILLQHQGNVVLYIYANNKAGISYRQNQ